MKFNNSIFALLLFLFAAVTAAPSSSEPVKSRSLSTSLEEGRKVLLGNPSQALQIARQLENAAAQQSGAARTELSAGAGWLSGAALIGQHRFEQAEHVLAAPEVNAYVHQASKTKLAGDIFMARGVALFSQNKVEQALPSFQRAYNTYAGARELRSQASALLNIGAIYLLARDYSHALNYYTQALDTNAADPSVLMAAYANRGQASLEMNDSTAAIREFRRAVDLAVRIDSVPYQERYLSSLAHAELAAGNLPAAEGALARGYKLAATAPPNDWLRALDWTAAELALKQHRLDAAATLIERTFADRSLFSGDVTQRDWLRTGYEIYKAKGDEAKALTYLEAYKQADDKARSLAASASAALMSARFDYVNQQAQIRQLHSTQEAQAAAARERLRATILNAVLLAAFVILTLLLFGYISIRRSRDQVRAANDDLSQSNGALEKALAARTEFLAMTSHEIRTPLNGILGMTQVLLADRQLDPPMRGKIELVHGAGEAMKALVDDLLDVAKMTTGEIAVHPAEMDLRRLLREAGQVWAGQAEARGIGLALEVDVPARIVADEVRLRQIVFNLMSNAIKFTDQGEVRLVAGVADAGGGGERLRLAISDSGIGVPAEKLEEIFESFRQVDAGVTRRHGGTGLGLSICRSLARAMGGDVTVTSALGAGSTFVLEIPLVRVAEAAPAPAPAAAAETLADAALLVIEGNPISQSVLRSVLAPHVRQVRVVDGLDQALRDDAGERAEQRIDLLLADGATLGLDLAAVERLAAAADARGARLALLWPSPDEATRGAALAAGAAIVIAKPIGASDLVATLVSLYKAPARQHLAA